MVFMKANESDFMFIRAHQDPLRGWQALPIVLMAIPKPITVVTKKPK